MAKHFLVTTTFLAVIATGAVAQSTEAEIGPDRSGASAKAQPTVTQAFVQSGVKLLGPVEQIEQRRKATERCLADAATGSALDVADAQLACAVTAAAGQADNYDHVATIVIDLGDALDAARTHTLGEIEAAKKAAAGRQKEIEAIEKRHKDAVELAKTRRAAARDDGEYTYEERREAQGLRGKFEEIGQELELVHALAEADSDVISSLEAKRVDLEESALLFYGKGDDFQKVARENRNYVEEAYAKTAAKSEFSDDKALWDALSTLSEAVAKLEGYDNKPDPAMLPESGRGNESGKKITDPFSGDVRIDQDPYAFLDATPAVVEVTQ